MDIRSDRAAGHDGSSLPAMQPREGQASQATFEEAGLIRPSVLIWAVIVSLIAWAVLITLIATGHTKIVWVGRHIVHGTEHAASRARHALHRPVADRDSTKRQ